MTLLEIIENHKLPIVIRETDTSLPYRPLIKIVETEVIGDNFIHVECEYYWLEKEIRDGNWMPSSFSYNPFIWKKMKVWNDETREWEPRTEPDKDYEIYSGEYNKVDWRK